MAVDKQVDVGIHVLLENPVYRGALLTGMRREGRFFVMQGDRATRRKNAAKTSAGNVRVEKKAESEWIVSEGAHDALVPPEEWHAVQQRKTSRETRRTHAGVRTSYFLAGLTKCMRCGFRYQGRTTRNVKGIESRSYTCGGYHAGGTSICRMGSIAKEAIERPTLEMIRKLYFEIEDEAALEDGIRAELGRAAMADAGAAETATLRKRRQALKLKIDAWLEELTILPQSTRALLREKLAAAGKEIEWRDAETAPHSSVQVVGASPNGLLGSPSRSIGGGSGWRRRRRSFSSTSGRQVLDAALQPVRLICR